MKRSYFPIELFLECISWKSYSFLYVKFMITKFRQFVNMAYRSIIISNLLYSLWTLEEQKHHCTCPKSSRYSLLYRKRNKERAPEENSLSFLLLGVKMCLHMHRFIFSFPFWSWGEILPLCGASPFAHNLIDFPFCFLWTKLLFKKIASTLWLLNH